MNGWNTYIIIISKGVPNKGTYLLLKNIRALFTHNLKRDTSI